MYKKLTAIVVAMAMVLTSSMVVMASAPAENEGNVDKIEVDKILAEAGYTPGDIELAGYLEAILSDVTEEGDFDPEDIGALRRGLFKEYGHEEEEEEDVVLSDLFDVIDLHLLEESSEYLEAGDETIISRLIGDFDEQEDGTLQLLGYFTVINFDADEENPENLLFKNGIGLTELITLELNEDGEYEVTDCIPAEDGEAYTDSVEEMCELIGIDPDVFYEKLAFCDLAFASDLHNFLEENPEYDYVDYMGELVSHEDLDNIVDELFYDYLALYGLAELVEEIDAAETTEGEAVEEGESVDAESAESASTESADTETTEGEEEQDASVNTQILQLGTSSYTIEIPESFEEGEKSEKDVKNDMVAYMKSSDYGMDFDVYQFGKEGLPENVADLALEEAKSYDTTEIYPALDINGINVACCRAFDSFEGKTYDTLTYYLDDGDTYLEIVFWLDGDNAEELTDMIISTLSSTKN